MGTRQLHCQRVARYRDHPHAYGDKLVLIYGISLIAGSSPRVWGQEIKAARDKVHDRIIPTRMGTRMVIFGTVQRWKDHPHAYGDKAFIFVKSNAILGSSPRVWGQGHYNCRLLQSKGIIPTRMGTRTSTVISRYLSRDHPHAYGDKMSL